MSSPATPGSSASFAASHSTSAGPTLDSLPLFPLHTVLFPDGLLPLRVFEARYVDMVRACMRDRTPFGVCLIASGNEVARPDEPTMPETIGCLADIIDCNMEQLGVLLISARGRQRFRLLGHSVNPDGLLVGQAELLPPYIIDCKLELLGECLAVLRRIVARSMPSTRASCLSASRSCGMTPAGWPIGCASSCRCRSRPSRC